MPARAPCCSTICPVCVLRTESVLADGFTIRSRRHGQRRTRRPPEQRSSQISMPSPASPPFESRERTGPFRRQLRSSEKPRGPNRTSAFVLPRRSGTHILGTTRGPCRTAPARRSEQPPPWRRGTPVTKHSPNPRPFRQSARLFARFEQHVLPEQVAHGISRDKQFGETQYLRADASASRTRQRRCRYSFAIADRDGRRPPRPL